MSLLRSLNGNPAVDPAPAVPAILPPVVAAPVPGVVQPAVADAGAVASSASLPHPAGHGSEGDDVDTAPSHSCVFARIGARMLAALLWVARAFYRTLGNVFRLGKRVDGGLGNVQIPLN